MNSRPGDLSLTKPAPSTKSAIGAPAGGALSLFVRVRTVAAKAYATQAAALFERRGLPAKVEAPYAAPDAAASGWGGRALLYSFLGLVIVPTIIAAIYFAFIASDQYVSETRLTVRAASDDKKGLTDALSAFSKLGIGGGGKTTVQDSYIVLNYLRSRSIVEDIGGRAYLEDKFSKSDIDFYSSLARGKTIEDLWKYWSAHVVPTMDSLAGIVTIKVYAYRPLEAQAIARQIVDLSEILVNKVSDRARAAAVAEAEADVVRAERDLSSARADLQNFRNQSVTIDPIAKASSIGELIGKLMIERSEIENNIVSFSGSLSNNSPAVRIQKSRLDALDKQIAELRAQLTSTDGAANTISAELAKFEQLKLNEKFAERKYDIASMSFDKAGQEMRRQKLFLALIVPPSLPERAQYPERGISILLAFAISFILWGIISLVAASIADHFA